MTLLIQGVVTHRSENPYPHVEDLHDGGVGVKPTTSLSQRESNRVPLCRDFKYLVTRVVEIQTFKESQVTIRA